MDTKTKLIIGGVIVFLIWMLVIAPNAFSELFGSIGRVLGDIIGTAKEIEIPLK